jgi:heme/copper-type cytochrome/quinol oxidase subunit 3
MACRWPPCSATNIPVSEEQVTGIPYEGSQEARGGRLRSSSWAKLMFWIYLSSWIALFGAYLSAAIGPTHQGQRSSGNAE